MGYQQGLSGLSAASSDLDVIGNNIANSDTVGFKSGTAVFADMYANSVATAVNNQIGIGTQLAAVQQNFSQGTADETGQALDMFINGNGFFQMSENGSLTYSRNGVFQRNAAGQIENAQGALLMGYGVNADGTINTSKTVPLTLPNGNSAPAATTTWNASFNLDSQDALALGTPTVDMAGAGTLTNGGATITTASAGSNNDTYQINFTSATQYTVTDVTAGTTSAAQTYTAGQAITLGTGQQVTLTGTAATGNQVVVTPTPVPFDASNPKSYTYNTQLTAYDSLGGSQTVNVYFAKTSSGVWDVYAGVAGGTTEPIGQATFTTNGTMSNFQQANVNPTTGAVTYSSPTTPNAVSFTIPTTDGSGTPQTVTLNLSGSTQYGSSDGNTGLTQDGYASGQLSSYTVGNDGVITGNYTNGATVTLGQLVLANFNDPNGLVDLGNNEYAATGASGPPQIATPGSTNHGQVTGGEVEDSNVDLTSELVNLITAQRDYQANAQTIKTQQTVDQTLINL
ncbi:flagellar hook protein FlgE [Paraburkholderia sp. DHOC27]|uniref:flagellar hook protein FlgE n=1 Tax=Paraburkholderia sp. DHOC27 TaxID=2303330 RepID=UPI000E3D56CE|nr:flagellar hook protein FlgE [Paraburkholderia sp. DHOC27]RFU47505.1 flagellar hook-basal body complex protein [Paraburkholderia sp. DHOC27]